MVDRMYANNRRAGIRVVAVELMADDIPCSSNKVMRS